MPAPGNQRAGSAAHATHFDPGFVSRGAHRAVAEALNEGGCDALARVVGHFAPGASVECVPLFVYCTRRSGAWELTSVEGAAAFERDARRLIRSRKLRAQLLEHAAADAERANEALRGASAARMLVLRVTLVFDDESSHVNAVAVRGRCAHHFEPKLARRDTLDRPFGSVHELLKRTLARRGVATFYPTTPAALVLQTDDDDLCQTWVAAYVVEMARAKDALLPSGDADAKIVRVLWRLAKATPRCDRLCTVLRFSQRVHDEVGFQRASRRGTRIQTLAESHATTTRTFSASPRPCRA